MRYLIQNADIVNEGAVIHGDLLIENGIIAEIAQCGSIPEGGARTINAEGRYLIPGIIDEHVHFREPGLTQKADILTESKAAVAGGVTSFMDMPNTVPPTVTKELLEEKFQLASEKSLANYSFYIGATNDNLKEILDIDTGNICGIKLFMGSSTGNMLVDNSDTIEALFRDAPCLIAAHCEDEQIIRDNTARWRAMAEAGKVCDNASLHPLIRSAEACATSTGRAVELAEKTGARLHLLHISTGAELGLLRNDIPLTEKKITAETCPHYLHFNASDYEKFGFAIKCNPAIKSSAEQEALLRAVGSGIIDTIGSDHAPHLREEKFTSSYFTSKSGFPSIQHTFQLMYEASLRGVLTLPQIVALMCHNPATLYRIARRGFIRKGCHADLAIVDTGCGAVIGSDGEYSKCGWTPYEGLAVHSRITHTFVNGHLVYENGEFDENERGCRLTFGNN